MQGPDDNFYGTTFEGGGSNNGTVFRITPSGGLTTLASFNKTNGRLPYGELAQGTDGNFYGTTALGGSNDNGTVFRITPTGDLTTLCSFNVNNGAAPDTGLVMGSDGNFYGTTNGGGDSGYYGSAFRITPGGTLTTLASFSMGMTGQYPHGRLVQGNDGDFYGTTWLGGENNCGTVFRITSSGSLSTVFSFNGTNGANSTSGLTLGSDGNFYGTASAGGSSGDGTVFRMSPSGVLTTLCAFSGANGAEPGAGLTQGNDGKFYGTTQSGGENGNGTLFSITASGSLTTLYSFSGTDGQSPYAVLIQASNGNFYGTTSAGGSSGSGTVFEFAPSTVTAGITNGFNYQVLATNNPESYNAEGLPSGLSIDSSTGQISGTSREVGTFNVSLCATNPGGTGTATLTIVVTGTPVISSALNVTGTNATAFSYQIAATATPISYGASGLPPGLSVNTSTGLISGTPTATGTFNVSINATNAFGTANATVAITVEQMPAPVITSALNAAGNNGFSFYYRIAASGNPTSYGASELPAGLSINTATGLISGTSAAEGTSNVTITASNLGGTDSKNLVITMEKNTAPRITLPYKLITLCSFNGTNGSGSYGGLVQGNDGDFYGTTTGGGYNNSSVGTVFQMTPDGTLTTLHSFQASEGANPSAGLIKGSDGNFYGTTKWGGNGSYGTAFQITPGGTLTTLGSFSYSANGSNPYGGLVQGNDGNFYGTTEYGLGVNGTVFKVTPDENLTTLVAFTFGNGSNPYAGLLLGSDGNFYGTTTLSSTGRGTVFKITATGILTTLYSFSLTGADGGSPEGGLIQGSDGNFYGTTWSGGSGGGGTVFQFTPDGLLTTLHNFAGTDGEYPYAALAQGQDGNFYGTTVGGGNGHGTVFQITPDGTLATLYSFSGTDGASPYGGLLQGTDGNFYGTTYSGGGNGGGTVFEIGQGLFVTGTNNSSNYQIVATNAPSGYTATGLPTGLSVDTGTGLISGTATVTGTFSVPISVTNGDGTASATMTIVVMPSPVITSATTTTVTRDEAFSYQIVATNHATSYAASGLPDGLYMDAAGLISGWPTVTGTFGVQIGASNAGSAGASTLVITVIPPPPTITNLLTLCTFETANHNATSLYGGLVQGRDGNFYGTIDGADSGEGAVFRLTPDGVWTTLYSFSGTDGARPYAGLAQGTDGDFYGTTWSGGSNGLGVVFKITSNGSLTTLYSFSGTDGASPYARLVQGTDGDFYGTTYSGGGNDSGTVFKITPSGNLTTLHSFDGPAGANPFDGLVQGTDGDFYGTTANGGSNGGGTVFKITPSGNLTTLYSFNGTNGCYPKGGLIQSNNGDFYGTTVYGGSAGWGTVFRITSSGVLTTLYSFSWGDGADPSASLVEGSDGNFYGTTNEGGPYSPNYGFGGTVFQMTPDGTATTLNNFSEAGGSAPTSPLIQGSNGSYYGTTSRSGNYLLSTAFECAPSLITTGTTHELNYHILASNSPTSYTASGLPAGLNLDTARGLINGVPTVTGTFSVAITATNAGGSGSGTITIVVPSRPAVTSALSVIGMGGTAFSYQIAASNSPNNYSADGLPAGLNVDTATGLIGGTPTVTGTFNSTISAGNVSGTGSASLTIIVQPCYAAWQNLWFTASELTDSTISGDTATPAGDGIPNLIKYALNLNPKAQGVRELPVPSIAPDGSNCLRLIYTQVISATDITYIPEVSADLQKWHSWSDSISLVSTTNNSDGVTQTVIVQDLTPINSTNRRFVRLRITKP